MPFRPTCPQPPRPSLTLLHLPYCASLSILTFLIPSKPLQIHLPTSSPLLSPPKPHPPSVHLSDLSMEGRGREGKGEDGKGKEGEGGGRGRKGKAKESHWNKSKKDRRDKDCTIINQAR